ncbi:unnamed protein product [Calypogeia fissa]
MVIAAPISSAYCVPQETQLEIKPNSCRSDRKHVVNDGEGVLLFNMETNRLFVGTITRRILDATSGNVLLLLKIKKERKKRAWKAVRGDSQSKSELLFTLKPSDSYFSSPYEMFLSGNDSSHPDFSIQGKSRLGGTATVLCIEGPIAEGMKYS